MSRRSPRSKPKRGKQQVTREHRQEVSYSGPLPLPHFLDEYERIYPGAAAKIFAMAEEQQSRTLAMQDEEVRTTSKLNTRGQWMGFVLAILFLGAAVYGIYAENPLVAGILAAVGGVNLISAFLKRSNK